MIDAIKQVQQDGLRAVLVTGRIGAELEAEFPDLAGVFDAVILENGAMCVVEGDRTALAPPVDTTLDDALAARGIPYRRGEVLLASDSEHAVAIAEAIAELGLDCQIVHNRAALMVLPAGVTKGTGLEALLATMKLSPHNALAVGDAENDLALFAVAEIGVAVANAIPSVQRHADLVLEKSNGAGVVELLTGPILSLTRRWCPPRRWIGIGAFDDGTPAQVPGSQARIMVTGPAGSGKSYLVGLMAERWIEAGYSVIVLDPEGDHLELQHLNQVQTVVVRDPLPEPAEMLETLHPRASLVVDLSALDKAQKIDYLQRMRLAAEVHREISGFPHWVVYDEAHLLGPDEQAPWTRRGGYVLSSFTPAAFPASEIYSAEVVLELPSPDGSEPPLISPPARRATVRVGSDPARPFIIADRRTAHVRHRHKYADVSLPKHRRFYFRTTDGHPAPVAGTMHEFHTAISHLDPQALEYHLQRGDLSRWLRDIIADKNLADQVAAWEDELQAHRAADLERIRRELGKAIDDRYLS
ncbi:HAD hydrolase family protein [Mycolicibacterium sp. yt]|uniref:HAD hydrolase family protein n=1 Tax=Mycolicibacterium sp. yt TaxID=2973093 RepID=UPI00351CE898